MKKVVEEWKKAGKSEDEIKDLQKGVQNYFAKTLSPNFKDLDFYTGESMDPDGMSASSHPLGKVDVVLIECYRIVFMNYREDGVTPYMHIVEDKSRTDPI